MIVVRFADDFVVGFQHRSDAERLRKDLEERFDKFKLRLHPEKTRLIEFGYFAANNRPPIHREHSVAPFLATDVRKRDRAKLKEIKAGLRRRMHEPVPQVGKWLKTVIEGHNRYYGVPSNTQSLSSFRFQVARHWFRSLRRRSQRTRLTWERMYRLIDRWLPPPRVHHPYPLRRLGVIT